ncbi:ATP-binding protein [Porticoccus sp. W117]|uniref:ATP-binding protein n=1 Tax=Porticoccus sp. W117 TaxID=3054777 RepID=UPI002599CFB4|nr:ATP-binding protein [Porticoccus sp. W117]MDM3872410.1 ATP-binding protein [Porticoccus sp. W117]
MLTAALSLLLFAALLFGAALVGRRRQFGSTTQALVTLGSLGALSYFGLPEMAGRYGLEALFGLMAFTLVFLLGPLVMRPVHWAAQTRRLPTLADLFSYRYRSTSIGPLVTSALALSCLPLLAGQLQLAGDTLQLISNNHLGATSGKLFFALLLLLLLFFFGQRRVHSDRLMTTLALGSVVTLAATLAVALWACWHYFGSLQGMQQWANSQGLARSIHRSGNSYPLISLFLLASLTLPHLYHQQSWLPSSKSRELTGWLFPLLLLIATLTMVPLLWSGVVAQLPVALQLFLPALAQSSQSTPLLILATVGGLFACSTVTVVTAKALVAMASSYLFPVLVNGSSDNLYQKLVQRRRQLAASWIGLGLITSQFANTHSISTLTIISLVGVVQLAPGLLSALYVPILNRRGVVAGLAVGMTLWVLGLLVPLFTGSWQWQLGIGNPWQFGYSSWGSWLLISLAANFTVSLLVTRRTRSDDAESYYARASMIEKVSAPQRIAPQHCHLPTVRQRLSEQLGSVTAQQELQRLGVYKQFAEDDSNLRPFEWRQLRSELNANLYPMIGVIRGDEVINQVLPLVDNGDFNMGDLRTLESLLAERQQPLYGLAAELNKLRIHHQNMLHELPLGACSLDRDDEVVLWNKALEKITGIPSATATGSHLSSLPQPWQEVLQRAASSNSTHKFAIEVEDGSRKVRFNLHKTLLSTSHQSNPHQNKHDTQFAEQVILLEDISDVIQITQEIAHTERLASVGRLAAGVAHEIGNPVTGIACLAQDIISDANHDDQRQSAETILTQVERISKIVRSLVEFSRSGHESDIELIEVDLEHPLQQAVELLALNKEHSQSAVELSIDEPLQVRGDPHQLTQIFLNLLTNARDANADSDGSPIEVTVKRYGTWAQVDITDSGSGIEQDKIDKVLEPFFTTKPVGEGTGLGLSLVYSMLRSYGGELSLHSPVANGRGTRATVTLPLSKESRNSSQ